MSEKKSNGHGSLTLFIIGAIVLAILFGWLAPGIAVKFKVGGKIFLNLLMMMVVPLVIMSVMSGILGLGDVRKLGKPGGFAVGYYMCTTVLAVVTGLIMVNLLKPGVNKELAAATAKVAVADNEKDKKTAEEELATLKETIQKDLDKSAEDSEEAKQAKLEQEIREGKFVTKAEKKV